MQDPNCDGDKEPSLTRSPENLYGDSKEKAIDIINKELEKESDTRITEEEKAADKALLDSVNSYGDALDSTFEQIMSGKPKSTKKEDN